MAKTKTQKVVNKILVVCLIALSFILLVYSSYMVILTGKFIKTKAYVDLSVSNFSEALELLKIHDQYRVLLLVSIAIVGVEVLYIVIHKWLSHKVRAWVVQMKTSRTRTKSQRASSVEPFKPVDVQAMEIACQHCGHLNKMNVKFCVNCGALMEGKHES